MSLVVPLFLLKVLITIIIVLFFVFIFLTKHKKINMFLVKYLFNDSFNIFSYFLINMNLNKSLKDLLNKFKEVYYITLCANKKFNSKTKKTIKLPTFLQKLKTNNLKIYLLFQNTSIKNILPNKLLLIIRPISNFNNKNNLSKMFIRKSKFFAKTKYSWIRQECKSIVHLVLLFNITVVLYAFATYMHWGIKTNIFFALVIYYIITYFKNLFTIRGSINKILTLFKFYKRPQFLNKRILKSKVKKLLKKILNNETKNNK